MRQLSTALLGIASAVWSAAQSPPRPIPFNGPSDVQVTLEKEGTPGDDPAGRLEQLIQEYEPTLGRALPGAPPKVASGPGGTFASVTRRFGTSQTLHGFLTGERTGAICHVQGTGARAVPAMTAALKECAAELKAPRQSDQEQSAKVQPAPRPQPAARESVAPNPPAQPPHPENWSLVAGVYFRSTYGGGVGGMVVMDYEPLVFFKDGTYLEIDEAALEDIDLAREKAGKPKRWGSWKQAGNTFILTGSSGKPNSYKLQQGNFFQAFPAESGGNRLTGAYNRLSGGGNTAMGGEIMVAVSSRMRFDESGHFTTNTSVGAMNSGAQSGVGSTVSSNRKMASPGSYQLGRFTITLNYPDGKVKRSFFAFGSEGTPPRADKDMIFIGDLTYITD